MTTEDTLDSSEATTEQVPTPSETDQPSVEETEATESVEELKEKLAAAENEAKTWKGRVEKANVKKPKSTTSEEIKDLEWRLENKERISLVKDEYEKILEEGYDGEPVSKKIALELAEKRAKIDTSDTRRGRQDDMTVASVTTRTNKLQGYESETDKSLNLTLEKKRKLEQKHPHLTQV